jgi:hypothetical protein
VAEGRLEGDPRPTDRSGAAHFRRRDGSQYLAFSDLCLCTEGTEGILLGSAQPRAEHDALLSWMSVKGMGPSLAVEGATNREVFKAYIERTLSPKLRPGQVVW